MIQQQKLQSWLNLVCTMIQGAQQAVFIPGADADESDIVYWPMDAAKPDALMASARQAQAQTNPLVQLLNKDQAEQTIADYIIAKPLQDGPGDAAVIALQLRMSPQQQKAVLQLLSWGEKWLQLLTNSSTRYESSVNPAATLKSTSHWRSKLQSSRGLLLGLAALVIFGIAGLVTGTHRVSAPAFLEGSVQRVIVAPFEGYIASASKQAGDPVTRDEVLAEMDAQALWLSQQQFESEKDEYNRQYRQALSRRDMAEAHIHKLQINQADAQLSLIQQKLDKAVIRSPMDGVLIAGDLRQSQGAPVKLGDILFEVAPLDAYRLVIHVDERDITQVKAGARGLVNLRAIPDSDFTFQVVKVSPVYEDKLDTIAYRVEASLDLPRAELRPGMQGVAKIEVGQRSYLWIYLHELYDAIRLWLWKWLP